MKLIGYLTGSHTLGKENTEISFFVCLMQSRGKMNRSLAGRSSMCTAVKVSLKTMTKRGQLEKEIEIEIRDDFEACKDI